MELGVLLTIIGYLWIALLGGTLIMGDPWAVIHNPSLSAFTVLVVAFVAFNAAAELKKFFQ
ncbi:MAG: hypothetical protein COX44_03275 [Candidatus Portnoybacteria bacterium CG23_combo_of_CG06-09_8_20_14_all_37_13]|uniref:Uncharacterized protein n=1 Tax=Candidatus Portnoybacteria bacterium CG23_combo_of_CG06-09_8_20_14_all_37_13 TaxID=1974819 RepID=A0A2G9YC81_9BACT|nr:MAG: hypothetical protein COX44_03275 [Candidatus Portnoybacteria bacterium CG23_combo_of_CG06-09_8_20_14_all_37_13]